MKIVINDKNTIEIVGFVESLSEKSKSTINIRVSSDENENVSIQDIMDLFETVNTIKLIRDKKKDKIFENLVIVNITKDYESQNDDIFIILNYKEDEKNN